METETALREILAANNPADLMLISPWAWYISELKAVFPEFRLPQPGFGSMRTDALLMRELGERKVAMGYHTLSKNEGTNMIILKNERIIYRYIFQPTRRLLMEYACLKKKYLPNWFKFLIFLCKNPGEHTLKEIAKATGISDRNPTEIERYPPIFNEGVIYEQGAAGWRSGKVSIPNLFGIHPDFYEKIYRPMEFWLTEKGISEFKKWKKLYHFRRNSKQWN